MTVTEKQSKSRIWPSVSTHRVGGLGPDVSPRVASPNICIHPETPPEGERPFYSCASPPTKTKLELLIQNIKYLKFF